MPPVGPVTASLFTRDLLEKPSRLLFITSLYIYPHRVNRPHLALPRFVLAGLSLVMNKTRPEGPHPSLFILFPWGSNLSPTWHHQQVPSPLPIPSMIFSTSTALPSSSPPPTACRSWFNPQQPQYKRTGGNSLCWELKTVCEGEKELILP